MPRFLAMGDYCSIVQDLIPTLHNLTRNCDIVGLTLILQPNCTATRENSSERTVLPSAVMKKMASYFDILEYAYSTAICVLPIPPMPQRAKDRREPSLKVTFLLFSGRRFLSIKSRMSCLPKKSAFLLWVFMDKQGNFGYFSTTSKLVMA
jgi:hypothetical protein